MNTTAAKCPRANCDADTASQQGFGHCLHCGHHIGATNPTDWTKAVRAKCSKCRRNW